MPASHIFADAAAHAPHPRRSPKGAFASNFAAAHAAGLVYLPTAANDCKKPIVANWTRFRSGPRLSTCARWAERMPDANGAYVPGPSGLVVFDADDRSQEDSARAQLGIGDTPLIIQSGKRGLHFPCRTDRPIPTINLRPFGIAGEIKGVRSIVAAPGSRHPETCNL